MVHNYNITLTTVQNFNLGLPTFMFGKIMYVTSLYFFLEQHGNYYMRNKYIFIWS